MQDGGAVQDGEPGKGGTWEGSVADKASNHGRHLSAELIAQNRTGSPTTAQTNGDQIIEKEGKKEASGEPLPTLSAQNQTSAGFCRAVLVRLEGR